MASGNNLSLGRRLPDTLDSSSDSVRSIVNPGSDSGAWLLAEEVGEERGSELVVPPEGAGRLRFRLSKPDGAAEATEVETQVNLPLVVPPAPPPLPAALETGVSSEGWKNLGEEVGNSGGHVERGRACLGKDGLFSVQEAVAAAGCEFEGEPNFPTGDHELSSLKTISSRFSVIVSANISNMSPSTRSSWKGAGTSQTGHFHAGFRSLMRR